MLNILVIDDDISSLKTLSEFLRSNNHRVITASDGAQGLQILNALTFHVVLCDVYMPKIDGLEVLHEVKGRYPNTDVFLITGKSHFDAVAAIKDGAADYLNKPFPLDELQLRLERISRKRQVESKREWARRWSDPEADSPCVTPSH